MSWTYENLASLFEEKTGYVTEKEGDCLSFSNDEGVDAFLFLGDSQIIVETALFPLNSVEDLSALNEVILRSHQLVPLTTVGIKQINNEDYYVAFGALSSDSKEEVVIQEVETLFENVADFLDLYSDYLKKENI